MKFRIPVKILKDRMVLFFLGISLYILLVICYKTQISPLYSYMGYNYKPFSFDIWFICSLISLFPLIFLPISINKPSDIASWFLYLFLFFPSSFVIPMVSKLDFLSSISFVLILMLMFWYWCYDWGRMKWYEILHVIHSIYLWRKFKRKIMTGMIDFIHSHPTTLFMWSSNIKTKLK